MKIIDTHIHIWDLDSIDYGWLKGDTSILNQTYHLSQLDDVRKEVGITGGILVQADNHFLDTDWMLKNASESEWIQGVVGWVPLQNPKETGSALDKYLKNPYFKGVRHLIHDEKDPKWLLQDPVIQSLKLLAVLNVPFDVVGVLTEHIETVLEVAEQVPNLKMVFDHMNQPPIPSKEFGKWGDLMKEASKNPNIHQKISGLGTASGNFNDWSEDDIKPYIAFAIENFGPERCFCGGDWPVSLLAGQYVKTWSAYKSILNHVLSIDDQEKVFFQSATNFYNLKR